MFYVLQCVFCVLKSVSTFKLPHSRLFNLHRLHQKIITLILRFYSTSISILIISRRMRESITFAQLIISLYNLGDAQERRKVLYLCLLYTRKLLNNFVGEKTLTHTHTHFRSMFNISFEHHFDVMIISNANSNPFW